MSDKNKKGIYVNDHKYKDTYIKQLIRENEYLLEEVKEKNKLIKEMLADVEYLNTQIKMIVLTINAIK